MKRFFQRACAMILLCVLLCGCTVRKEFPSLTLPGRTPEAAQDTSAAASALESTDAPQTEADEESYHLEYQTLSLPAPLLSVTALTVVEDAVILGGFTENGLSLTRMTLDGACVSLPLPDGAAYLYALAPDGSGGIWLLSGSLPAAYTDGRGAVHFLAGEIEGALVLTHYDAAFTIHEHIPLQTVYPDGPRFFQLCAAEDGFLLLSGSLLVSLDTSGAELARQTTESDDGWRYQSMALTDGTLCVLTRNHYGAQPPELRRFAPDTLDAMEPLPCPVDAAGLGLAADGRLLLGSRESVDACAADLSAAETLVVWRELGVTSTADELLPAASGFVLFSQGDTELTLLRRIPGPAPEKIILTLAIATDDPYFSSFTAMIEDFNRSQNQYLVDYTAYADSEALSDASELASADLLRTEIIAGQAPDLYAFYTTGYGAPPLTAADAGTDLLPLLGAELTENSLLPKLYALLTEDGCLYELPLTVQVDTMLGPASLFPKSGVTFSDLEAARQRMPEGMVPLDSWNTPENLFSLCTSYCIGAFTDRSAGTCSFETQSFYDYLAWCKSWGGDGSTPASPERTLVKPSKISRIGQLAGHSENAAEYWFGEPDYTYIGFPADGESSGSGYRVLTSLAVSPQCRSLDGAQAFLKYCFSYMQDDSLPASYALLRSEMDEYIAGNRTDWRGEVQRISETDAARFYALLESITMLESMDAPLAEILSEEANVYFAGGCTAEQAAKNIQSRASLYLQELYS